MDHWYYVETQQHGPFTVILDWTHEHAAIADCFDETVSDLANMVDRCNRHIDTHYIARVRAIYGGIEMGSVTLGSCYAYNCDPEDDMRAGLGGYLEDMIADVLDQARIRSGEMLNRLKRDFLEV